MGDVFPLGKDRRAMSSWTSLTMMDLNCLGKNLEEERWRHWPSQKKSPKLFKGTVTLAVAANVENREIASACPSARSWVVLPILLLLLASFLCCHLSWDHLPTVPRSKCAPTCPTLFLLLWTGRPNISHLISMHLTSPSPLSHTQG